MSQALGNAPSHEKRFVLYVEDQPVNVLLMQKYFERRLDYQLVVAIDGASAMEAARGFKPDLLLLDIGLPDCQGDDLLYRMRQIREWQNVPAVALTADHTFSIAGTTFRERWHKPLSMNAMLANLDRLLHEPELKEATHRRALQAAHRGIKGAVAGPSALLRRGPASAQSPPSFKRLQAG